MPDDSTIDRAFAQRLAKNGSRSALRFGALDLSAAELDVHAMSLARMLVDRGASAGDRVGIYLQNVPAFPIALLAMWRTGITPLLLNPMYRGEELTRIVEDAEPIGVFFGSGADPFALQHSLADTTVKWMVRVEDDWPGLQPDLEAPIRLASGQEQLVEALAATDPDVHVPRNLDHEAVALLAYTSGTTGPAKGAMVTNRGVLHVVDSYATITGTSAGEVVVALAPMFHITGAVLSGALGLLTDSTLVLTGRFDPGQSIAAIRTHRATSLVASITAYNAMLAHADAGREAFASVRAAYSGGAPVPERVVDRIRAELGFEVRNVYGMTETSSAATGVPIDQPNRVHPETGNLSIGKPLPGVVAQIVNPDGTPVHAGVQGELLLSGPSIMAGYWRRPRETRQAFLGGMLRTGDGAIQDADGWLYLVDRLKDQINVSGYKVWPREVEDALYAHPAVHEAAVVGRQDDYQGETVFAYVTLRSGHTVSEHELRQFVRERLAPYKVPRQIELVEQLPKTETGKIQRNKLRARPGR